MWPEPGPPRSPPPTLATAPAAESPYLGPSLPALKTAVTWAPPVQRHGMGVAPMPADLPTRRKWAGSHFSGVADGSSARPQSRLAWIVAAAFVAGLPARALLVRGQWVAWRRPVRVHSRPHRLTRRGCGRRCLAMRPTRTVL